MQSSIIADNLLYQFLENGDGDGESKKNAIRACSEALTYAVAKCFAPNRVWEGFIESFYPRAEDDGLKNTKLLVTIFSGGKAAGSAVKFAKFFLIIDSFGAENNGIDPIEI